MALRNAYDALSDDELVEAVLQREPAAWPTFFAKYERLVISCIRKVMRRYGAGFNDEDVEDLVSATALNIVKDDYKKLRAFEPTRGYKLSSWIGLIATNTAHDALRRRAPTEVWAAVALDDTAPVPLASNEQLASDTLEAEDQARELRAAVAQLSPADRLFMDYYYVQELEPEMIARLMSISVNTVYSRKNKIREKLRTIVGKQQDGRTRKGDAPRA
ncbi:MAG TPA: sigma-70 family RNA polymerase sigma factor [Polyangia bacterium]|nr:sigma-70 family RNA polymerase sigma factor [Polyangia bacterium]